MAKGSPLPLLLGAGALLLLAGGKKKKSGPSIIDEEFDPAETGGSSTAPTSSDAASSAIWKERQQNLKSWGYYPGPIDGKPGSPNSQTSKTRAGIRQFQQDWGLQVDSRWGKNTQGAYEKRLGGQMPPCPGGGSSNWGWGDDGWNTGGGGSSAPQWGSAPDQVFAYVADHPSNYDADKIGASIGTGGEIAISAGIDNKMDNVPLSVMVDVSYYTSQSPLFVDVLLRKSELQALSNGKKLLKSSVDGQWTFELDPVF